MKRLIWLGLLCTPLSLLPIASGAAEMYRWINPSGVITYSDQPPPASAQSAGRIYQQGEAPAAASEGQEKPAVQLYAFACGPLCDNAMAWLSERGIAYTLKNPQIDSAVATELNALTGALDVPVLKVGAQHYKGFEAANWTKLLTGAGYSVSAKAGQK